MDIQVLGAHNCESQNSKFMCLLIDDVLALDAGGLTSSLSFQSQQKLKAVLLTHQHYDHLRDVPALAMSLYLHGTAIDIYSTSSVHDALSTHMLNGKLYPKFLEFPQENPTIKFTMIEPHQLWQIESYTILAVPINHAVSGVGYQVSSSDGKSVFYTGDTGPGLTDCWRHVSPQLLIVEVTAPDKYEEFAKEVGHLTPFLLKQELISFREIKHYLPEVVVVHMNPYLEKEIESEIVAVASDLNIPITLACEGMRLHL